MIHQSVIHISFQLFALHKTIILSGLLSLVKGQIFQLQPHKLTLAANDVQPVNIALHQRLRIKCNEIKNNKKKKHYRDDNIFHTY